MKQTTIESPFFTVEEVAAYLHSTPGTIYVWSSRKKIPSKKVRGKLLFPKDKIVSWALGENDEPEQASQSKFQSAKAKLRSLKTEDITKTDSNSDLKKGE